MAIMNALMFQPQNTPKWGHRRTRVIMAHNTLIITIKCTKIIDADIIDANLSLKLDETKFKYTYIIYPSSIKYFSIRERERIWYHQSITRDTSHIPHESYHPRPSEPEKARLPDHTRLSLPHMDTRVFRRIFGNRVRIHVVSLSRDADAAIRLPINPRRGETR